jgi:hypothetical protein
MAKSKLTRDSFPRESYPGVSYLAGCKPEFRAYRSWGYSLYRANQFRIEYEAIMKQRELSKNQSDDRQH